MRETRETVYLGVDGGQTGTGAGALDATGSIKAIVRAPGLIHPLRSGGANRLRSVLERVRLGLPAGSPIAARSSPATRLKVSIARMFWFWGVGGCRGRIGRLAMVDIGKAYETVGSLRTPSHK